MDSNCFHRVPSTLCNLNRINNKYRNRLLLFPSHLDSHKIVIDKRELDFYVNEQIKQIFLVLPFIKDDLV